MPILAKARLSTTLLTAALVLAACGGKPPANRVDESQARGTALAAVPDATVKSQELEHEDGRWIYSYDLAVPGRSGIEEVHVDALTGKLVAREHEDEAAEAAEAAQEQADTTSSAERAVQNPADGGQAGNPAPVTEPYEPRIDAADFVGRVDNPYFPLAPGTVFRYRSSDGETDVVAVTDSTKMILGISATVVIDRVYENGALSEETHDWYAQDRRGNVWYLGEDSRELRNGRSISTSGSWEAGKNGARPGIIMEARPTAGDAYRQEYRKGVAEDMGKVLALGVSAAVPFGSFQDCMRTLDTTPLEPEVRETKVYCRGVGLVLENEAPGASNELVSVEHR